jgi:hypothetical protein
MWGHTGERHSTYRILIFQPQRGMPAGLSKRDEKALRKIRKRAHYLDKGMNLCG